jgi:hypothetical protein
MKLPNFLDWASLNQLRHSMGAPLAERFGKQQAVKDIALPPVPERLLGDGIEINFDDIDVLDDKTLGYKGYRVVVYIRDQPSYGRGRDSLPKFHLTYCKTLQKMKQMKRWERYVVNHRDDGKFKLNITDQGITKTVRLNVCQNCLGQIDWKGFQNEPDKSVRVRLVDNFSLSEFFAKYPRDLMAVRPTYTSDTAPINNYVKNWPEISTRTKQARGYRCEGCNTPFSGADSRFLDTHHRNGLKYDNADSNLAVLCIGCHAEEPMHAHMKADKRSVYVNVVVVSSQAACFNSSGRIRSGFNQT